MLERNDRINYPGLSQEYISDQISILTKDINEDNIMFYEGEAFIRACYQFFYGREADEGGLNSHMALIKDGMTKEGMMYLFAISEEFHQKFPVKYLTFYKRAYIAYQWDVSGVLQYNGWNFIEHCYIDILERYPDEAGSFTYVKLLAEGMPKEAIVYLIADSEEAHSVKGIKNIPEYKQAFDLYQQYLNRSDLKARIKRRIKAWIERLTQKEQIYVSEQMNHAQTMIRLHNLNELTQQSIQLNNSQNHNILATMNRIEENAGLLKQDMNRIYGESLAISEEYKQLQIQSSELVRKEVEAARYELRDVDVEIQDIRRNFKVVVQGYQGGVTCVQVGPFLMGVPSEEWRLAMYLSRYGAFEVGTEACFDQYIQSGMTVLDVGANLGIYTLHALAKGCEVYSYEPTPNTYHLLYENIWVNGYVDSPRVHLVQSAVGAAKGECSFTTYSDVCGHNSMFGEQREHSEVITVPVIALDEEFESGKQIDVIKIDVEGAEPLVFDGMQRILRENKDIKIFMEFAPTHLKRAGYDPEAFLKRIEDMGLVIRAIDDSNGQIRMEEHKQLLQMVSVNLLLMHASKGDQL